MACFEELHCTFSKQIVIHNIAKFAQDLLDLSTRDICHTNSKDREAVTYEWNMS